MKNHFNNFKEACDLSKPTATKFVVLIGIVSLFSDLTYEGARSVTGPFLAVLGASGTVVGIVAGFGELVGYALRLASGYWADKSQRYWTIVFLGYAMNLLAVPLLALAGHWEIAAIFMVVERMGKAIRTPARDVMLACASDSIGRGWGFGLHEALDQIGAILGPLVVAAVFSFRGTYQAGFALLLIPALIALSVLFTAYRLYPRPHDLGSATVKIESKGFPKSFWIYIIAIGCIAAGYADFPLVAYHFKKVASVPEEWIPLFYAIAMGVDALAALVFGRLFDRIGFSVLVLAVILSALFAPLVFLGGFYWALAGMALWGVGMGAQESIIRAAIAELVPTNRLGFAYGLFNLCYGLFWFLGSVSMGVLYDTSVNMLIVFSVGIQVISIPLIVLASKSLTRHGVQV
ncbi:MAG: MFS transporter [Deltaproteobacteria bacterium]|nr:MFS transporter [Deltaproteobacteria bacterium]